MDKKINNTFINGAIWLTLSTIFLKIIGVIYKIPISYLLGDEGMGMFNSAYTVYMMFYIIGSSGIPKAISIIVSKYEAEQENSSYSIYKTAFLYLSAIGLFLTVILFLVAEPLSRFVGNIYSWPSIVAISPTVFFVTASGVLRGYFSGRMNFAPIAISELIAAISKLGFGLFFAYIGVKCSYSLPITCAFSIMGMTIGSFLGMVYLYIVHKCKYNNVGSPQYDFKHLSVIVRLAFPLTLAATLSSAVNIIDLSMIMNGLINNGYSSVVSTVLYGNYTTLTVPMVSLVGALIAPITSSMQPIISKNYACKDIASAELNLKTCFSSIAFITIPVAVIFFIFPVEILSILFEKESAILAAPTLSLVSPSLFFLGATTVINMSLEAEGKTFVPMISLAGGAFVKLVLGIVLIKNTDLGILSAPIGTAASYAVAFIISYIYYKNLNFKKTSPFVGVIKPSLISAFSLCLALLVKKTFHINTANTFEFFSLAAVYGTCYLLSSLIFSKKTKIFNKKSSNMHKNTRC